MADPNAAINFVEYMKGVGDAVGNMAKEGAYGVYDFGQVVVGGSKILAKEGLGALGAKDTAAAITIEDIEPLSALGKVAVQGGYEGLGNAVKSMPANVANAVTDAAGKGDMRALGSAVTDAVLLAEGARAGSVGAVKGATKGVNALKSLAASEAKAVPKVAPVVDVPLKVAPLEAPTSVKTKVPSKPKAKAKVSRKKATKAKNPKTSNKACPSCTKKNNVKARQAKKNAKKTKEARDFSYIVKEVPHDLVADTKGVYGYLPKAGSQFSPPKWPVEWSNAEQVAAARKVRLDYHQGLASEKDIVTNLRSKGVSDESIARQIVEMRNQTRMSKYSPEQLPTLFERNINTYQNPYGPSFESLLNKYGSFQEIINAGTRSNATMDILTGIGKVK
jgi:hypothetical protein